LDYKLNDFELGRVFYHLCQRRGFWSNRKSPLKKDEDLGIVKRNIGELWKKISESGSRTLGEYFSRLNPETEKIRGRYTSRQMYKDEFDLIWKKQQEFGNEKLTANLHKKIFKTIFFQRKLKTQKGRIGACTFETDAKRCPWYRFEAQSFRLLQNVTNLRIQEYNGGRRELTSEERKLLIDLLEENASLTYAEARKLLGITNKKTKFTIEIDTEGEKKIKGNRTNAELKKVFSEKWNIFSMKDKEKVVHALISFEKDTPLKKYAIKKWGITEEKAEELAEIRLEEGYCNLSLKAIKKLIPKLDEGLNYYEALQKVYGETQVKSEILAELPVVREAIGDVRNPVVNRCISELRRCVNPIIKKYGKPDEIHIELARDIKTSNKQKERFIKIINYNEKLNIDAKKYLEERGIKNPSREDIIKYRLWVECKEQCPYTGRSIGFNDLFGDLPQFDIEHIIPYSICLENRFENLTLCYNEENRKVKHNKIPFETYYGNPEKYEEILSRVKGFNSRADIKFDKYKRFTAENTEDYADYASRQLNDTRYASRIAVDYLGLIYGGVIDQNSKRRIYAVSGGITAILRNYMGLNFVLGGGVKSREDHRHHTIDALAIALATSGNIQGFSHYAQKFENIGRVYFKYQFEPWKGFLNEVISKVNNIITVHHVCQKVRGAMHEDTFYGKGIKEGTIHLKRPLKDMKENEVDEIVDPIIKKIVKDKLLELSYIDSKNKDPKKAFSIPENLPFMRLKSGDVKTIKSVRICRNQKVTVVGKGAKERNVVLGNNHHMEIVAILYEKANETKWEGHIVSLYEAYQRKKKGEPLIKKDFGEGKLFKFSLSCGDYIELDDNGKRDIYLIRSIPESLQIQYVKPNDARKQKDRKTDKAWLSKYPEPMRKANCKKLTITPFGELRYAHD